MRWLQVICFVFTPLLLSAAPKSRDAYLVRPSSQTVKRRESVLALGQSKDSGSIPSLVEALSDRDPMTRSLAVRGLGSFKYAASRPKLEELLAGDPYPEVREAAAVSLRQIGDPQAVGALSKALKDSATAVRVTALAGISLYRDAKARPFVEAACKDTAVEVRRSAVYVLGRLEDPAAIPVIQGLLKDPDSSVRAGAAHALGELRAKGANEALLVMLKDPDAAARVSAARTLLMIGDGAGYAVAKSLTTDPNVGVRLVAVDALGWSKDPLAETELQTLLTQGPADTRTAVQEALTRTRQLRKQP